MATSAGAGQRSGGGSAGGRVSTVIFAVIGVLLVAVTMRSAAGVAIAPPVAVGVVKGPGKQQPVTRPPPVPTTAAPAEITFGDGADDKDAPLTPAPRTIDPKKAPSGSGAAAAHGHHGHDHDHDHDHGHGHGNHTHSAGHHHHHHGPASDDKDKALWRSTAPLPSGAGIARIIPGDALTEFAQIHHGIYRCQGKASKVKFAVKTECRPAQKWHGQQGWTEVAVHHFARLVFGPGANTVPPAVGALVALSAEQRAAVHRDGCGTAVGLRTGPSAPLRTAAVDLLSHAGADATEPLIGVGLEWRPKHSDEALDKLIKPRNYGHHWRVDALAKKAGGVPSAAAEREHVRQISDVTVLDFLVGNEDREDKNWFTVPSGEGTAAAAERFVAMDNGWAFIGRGYHTSVCSDDAANLLCPPLLRHLSGSNKCMSSGKGGGPKTPVMRNCRFRRETIDRLRSGYSHGAWQESQRHEWLQILKRDPLVGWLLEQYGNQATSTGDGDSARHFSVALARYVHRCPAPAGVPASGYHGSAAFLADVDTTPEAASAALLEWLAVGVERRMGALLAHVDECVRQYGESAVYVERAVAAGDAAAASSSS